MGDERIKIYSGRLDASQAEIVHFLEHSLEQIDLRMNDSGQPPDSGFGEYIFSYHKGISPSGQANLDREWEEALAEKEVGPLFLKTFWDENKWINFGAHFTSQGLFGYQEFYSGHVELNHAYPKKDKPTDVVIVSGWPTKQPYWEWVAKRLRDQFKERRKPGPGRPKRARPRKAKAEYRRILSLRNSAKWRLRTDKDFLEAYPQYTRSKLARAKRWAAEGSP